MPAYSPVISNESQPGISVTLVGMSYNEFLNSLSSFQYRVRIFRIESTSMNQVSQLVTAGRFDANGTMFQQVVTPSIDPYQKIPALNLGICSINETIDRNAINQMNILPLHWVRLTYKTTRVSVSDKMPGISNLGNITKGGCYTDIVIDMRNNTTGIINVSLLNIQSPAILGMYNSTRRFAWNMTSETFTNATSVSIQMRPNSGSYTTYSRTLVARSVDGTIESLNQLRIGIFFKEVIAGQTYIVTYNSLFEYGDLTINSTVVSSHWMCEYTLTGVSAALIGSDISMRIYNTTSGQNLPVPYPPIPVPATPTVVSQSVDTTVAGTTLKGADLLQVIATIDPSLVGTIPVCFIQVIEDGVIIINTNFSFNVSGEAVAPFNYSQDKAYSVFVTI